MNKLFVLKITALMLTLVFTNSCQFWYLEGAEEIKKDGFSITLQPHWIEVPKEVIDMVKERASQQAPEIIEEFGFLDYAFQEGLVADHWFDYPYIAIFVEESGRISEEHLGASDKNTVEEKEVLDKVKNALGYFTSDITVDPISYDDERKIIWMQLNTTIADIGKIRALASMHLTEKGFILVAGYTLHRRYYNFEAIFKSTLSSIKLEPHLRYIPRLPDPKKLATGASDHTLG